jgi:5-methylcytosine-specific restriction enzyme subunit McrC
MTDAIEFVETDATRELAVTPSELRALRRARHGLNVEEVADGRVRVGPRQGFAGTVLLPTGRRMVVHPKATVTSLPELLALAYHTMAPPATAGVATVEDATATDWLLLQLADEVEALLSRGLRRGYVARREMLPFVRGRMRPLLTPARLPLIDCEYADFVLDTTENQLLRGTLELLAPAATNPVVQRHLRGALAAFAEVKLVRPSTQTFDRVHIDRLNAHYEPALRLARLALEGAGVDDAVGTATAPAYFVLMWRVWEAAAAAALREAGMTRIHEQPEFSDRFDQRAGMPKLQVTLRPDILIGARSAPTLVIDLKWAPALTLRRSRKRLRNEHLYQLATYCTALRCDGLLLYPRMGDDVHSRYDFSGRCLTIRTIDLGAPALADLRAVATQIATDHSLAA